MFRWAVLGLFLLLNLFAFVALRRAVLAWVRTPQRQEGEQIQQEE